MSTDNQGRAHAPEGTRTGGQYQTERRQEPAVASRLTGPHRQRRDKRDAIDALNRALFVQEAGIFILDIADRAKERYPDASALQFVAHDDHSISRVLAYNAQGDQMGPVELSDSPRYEPDLYVTPLSDFFSQEQITKSPGHRNPSFSVSIGDAMNIDLNRAGSPTSAIEKLLTESRYDDALRFSQSVRDAEKPEGATALRVFAGDTDVSGADWIGEDGDHVGEAAPELLAQAYRLRAGGLHTAYERTEDDFDSERDDTRGRGEFYINASTEPHSAPSRRTDWS